VNPWGIHVEKMGCVKNLPMKGPIQSSTRKGAPTVQYTITSDLWTDGGRDKGVIPKSTKSAGEKKTSGREEGHPGGGRGKRCSAFDQSPNYGKGSGK